MLANEWDATLLDDWALNVPVFEVDKQQTGTDSTEYDFENFDNTGFTTIKIVLADEKAMQLMEKLESMKGEKNTSEYLYEHFCN